MNRYVCIVLGRWQFRNWHLYRLTEHHNHNGKVRWQMWDRVI